MYCYAVYVTLKMFCLHADKLYTYSTHMESSGGF